jgi:4-hydroxy-3-polyprenylbenzoate decarboxylase
MRFQQLSRFVREIETPLEVELEIPHLAYIEAKKANPQILLFKNPRRNGRPLPIPVVMNLYANREVVEAIFGRPIGEWEGEIERLVKLKPPANWEEGVALLQQLFRLKNLLPKRVSTGESQQVIFQGEAVDLFQLPILKSWELDGGPFITAGQVYTQSLDGKVKNVGLYRLQVYSKNRLGLHWQIHKDGHHLFWEYKRAKKPMPVSIAIGGDPLYLWAASAPFPPGIYELGVVGWLRGRRVPVVKSVSNPIEVPADADIVIEGWCNPEELEVEGMFGDHTGYYTLPEQFPVLNVTAITMKREPLYYSIVVGKPPVEDKWIGYPTERLFRPLLQLTTPGLVDYHLPEAGCFHNLLVGKIAPRYPGHSLQIAHSLWGVGQMSFLKNGIFTDTDAPPLTDYPRLTRYLLERFTPEKIFTSKGIVDQLDHSADQPLVGGKIGVDLTEPATPTPPTPIPDRELQEGLNRELEGAQLKSRVVALKSYFTDTPNPITIVQIQKREPVRALFPIFQKFEAHLRIVPVLNTPEVENPYLAVWRVTNNIDGARDLYISGKIVVVDGTNKSREIDNFPREWPPDVDPTPEVVEKLRKLGLVDLPEEFLKRWHLL